LLNAPFSFFKSSIFFIEPIFAVFPEPLLSLAIFHFSATKKSKSCITEVMETSLSTVVTSLSPTLSGVSPYSSSNSFT
jgi:hypothetical protein